MERLAGRVILLWGWRRAAAAFVAGVVAVFAQAPFDFPAVCFISFPVLVWLLDGAVADRGAGLLRRLAPAFVTGWWFGFGYFVAGLWWVGNALLVEADSFAWALPLAILGLPAILAVFYGLATAIARLLWSDGIGRILALAFAFGLAEWLRSFLLTGFPWNAVGYAAMPIPLLMQSASVVGLYGMNAIAVFVFAAPALLASRRDRRFGLAAALVIIAAHVGFGMLRPVPQAERTISLRAVQPSIDQSEKWDVDVRDRIFKTYLDMSSQPAATGAPRPDLIIWPETAVPFLFTDRPDALAALGQTLEDGQLLLAGAVRGEGANEREARFYNSIVAINDKGEIAEAFDKVHLVPFGEYLPFEDILKRIGLTKIVSTPMSFSAGSARTSLTVPGGAKAIPLICYEAIFPYEIGADAVDSDFILNVTNDAWFGDTPGPYQHFRQAQLRAVETGLPLVRVANNGITAVVGPDGRVLDGLAINAVGVLDMALPLARMTQPLGSIRVNAMAILIFFALSACVMIALRRRKLA